MRRLGSITNSTFPPAKVAKAATSKGDVSSFSEISSGAIEFECGDAQAPTSCAQCHQRPRLGTLTRCVECVRAAADVDRKSRTDAEARVSAKADRQAALEALGSMYLQFAATPEGIRFLESQQAELTAPNNDPNYVEALLARDKDRQIVANQIVLVHHAVLWGRNRLGLTLKDDRDHATARKVAGKLQQLLEAELLYEPDPHDLTKSAERPQKQSPNHEFGREVRSLGNEPRKRAPSKGGTSRGRK